MANLLELCVVITAVRTKCYKQDVRVWIGSSEYILSGPQEVHPSKIVLWRSDSQPSGIAVARWWLQKMLLTRYALSCLQSIHMCNIVGQTDSSGDQQCLENKAWTLGINVAKLVKGTSDLGQSGGGDIKDQDDSENSKQRIVMYVCWVCFAACQGSLLNVGSNNGTDPCNAWYCVVAPHVFPAATDCFGNNDWSWQCS